jgi:hypothetical protein
MFHTPMSSPKITTILGFRAGAACCALAVVTDTSEKQRAHGRHKNPSSGSKAAVPH